MCQTYSPRARIDQQKDQSGPSGRVCKTLKSKPASASFLEFLSLIFYKNLSETCKPRRHPDAVLQHFSNDSRLTERGKLRLLRLYSVFLSHLRLLIICFMVHYIWMFSENTCTFLHLKENIFQFLYVFIGWTVFSESPHLRSSWTVGGPWTKMSLKLLG